MELGELSRKGCLPALAALARKDPKPISASDFVKGSGMDAGAAIRLREGLEELGVITVKTTREQGSVREYAITLTEFGRDLSLHILAMEATLSKHAKKERRARK